MNFEKTEPKITGYVTPLRTRPGGELEFKISSAENRPFKAHVVRIDCADPNPAGPGIKFVPMDFGIFDEPVDGQYQPVESGSHGKASLGQLPQLCNERAFIIDFAFQAWLKDDDKQVLLSLQDDSGKHGIALYLQKDQINVAILNDLDSDAGVFAPAGLSIRHRVWYRCQWVFNRKGCWLVMQAHSLGRPVGDPKTVFTYKSGLFNAAHLELCNQLIFAAVFHRGAYCNHYNGRLGSTDFVLLPAIDAELKASDALFAGSAADHDWAENVDVLGSWDFSANTEGFFIPNRLTGGAAIQLVNAPMRAVCGLHWDATQQDWKVAPEQYAAVHFHADDLADCGWQTSLRLEIPQDAPSAVYGLVTENGLGQDCIPFFVLPPEEGPHAKVAYLASTYTYLAYGNHARSNLDEEFKQRIKDWDAFPYNPDEVSSYGHSTYNVHPDGHGISLSSRLRPLLSMRPGYLTFCESNGSGLRHFPADSHLLDWLRVKGIAFDVITDEDLHEDGFEVLKPYTLLLTGSHPEYHTRGMVDALIEFRERGGHFAYLGGNGFYWKIAIGGVDNSLLEVRRAEGGIRAWASEPGEYYHQLDGSYGGLWRRNGIAPQMIGAVGFAVQGEFEGSYYQRTEASYQPEVSWLFKGVESEAFGDFGLSGGGAAGFELDQSDPLLGTPEHTHVIAVSEGHGASFKASPEEIMTWTMKLDNQRPHPGISAHMTYTEPKEGRGSIFAAGSITFLGSLSYNNYDNDVSRIIENYINRCLYAY